MKRHTATPSLRISLAWYWTGPGSFQIGADDQYRRIHIVHDLIGDAAEYQPHNTRVSVGGHHHEVDFFIFHIITDMLRDADGIYDMQTALGILLANLVP